MFSNNFGFNPGYLKFKSIAGLSILFGLIFSLIFILLSFLDSKTAFAATPVLNLSPGQVARIVIYYDNSSSTNDFSGQARIKVNIDQRLDYVEGFLKDTYALDSRCVNDSSSYGIVAKTTVQGQTNATVIDYTPRSSTTAASSNICSTGSGSKGNTTNVTIPKATSSFNPNNVSTARGRLEFRVRLKTDTFNSTNLKIGDLIVPDINTGNVGISSEFSLNGVVLGSPQFSIKISGVVVTQNVVVSAACVGQPILIGEKAQCGFRLTGGNGTTDPYILPDDFKVQIEGSSGFANKDNCGIDNANGILTCLVPTINAAGGNEIPVNVTLSGATSVKTRVNLITDFDPKGDFDKDGISNEIECGFTSGRNCRDTDSDGILDYKDTDSDNDGIPDIVEAKCSVSVGEGFPCDTDGDKIPDYIDTDSDEDTRADAEEKGALKCDMTVIPATCVNELRDTDNDGIPNFRDKDDGNVDIRYLIKEQKVKFSYENQSKPIWGLADLTLNVSLDKDIVDCEIKFRKYSSQDWWITTETSISGGNCKTVLKAEKQYTQKWDTLIILTDKNGEKWGAYPSYSMENGSVGSTAIEAKIQDGVRT